MNITKEEKNTIITYIHKILDTNNELFYDDFLHRKVHSELYVAIPNGIESLCWFTTNKINHKPCIYIIQLFRKDKHYIYIKDIRLYNGIYKDELTWGNGTLFHGIYRTYMCNKNKIELFIPLNIYSYKNEKVIYLSFLDKFKIFDMFFNNDINNNIYNLKINLNSDTNTNTNTNLNFAFPIIEDNIKNIVNLTKYISYNISYIGCIQYINNHKYLGKCKLQIPNNITGNFIIKAGLEEDIYYLYCKEDRTRPYSVAFIQDYKTSVYMNKLYRNIKENHNLDTLEESDDEDDFENTDIDKYVDLEKEYVFECVFVKKFKKWKPIKRIDEKIVNVNVKNKNNVILTKKEALYLERKNNM